LVGIHCSPSASLTGESVTKKPLEFAIVDPILSVSSCVRRYLTPILIYTFGVMHTTSHLRLTQRLFSLRVYQPHPVEIGGLHHLLNPLTTLPSSSQLWPSPRFQSMSYTHSTTVSALNFQLIFNNALKAYEKRTKNDLLAHPLASQLQACNSTGAILAVLEQQVQQLNQSETTDERWTKWLDPTVNVLYSFSATLGEGVGMVCLGSQTHLRCAPSIVLNRYSHRAK
jgi:hypothetical protein